MDTQHINQHLKIVKDQAKGARKKRQSNALATQGAGCQRDACPLSGTANFWCPMQGRAMVEAPGSLMSKDTASEFL